MIMYTLCDSSSARVKGKDQTILIDTGYGYFEAWKYPASYLMKNAGKVGIRADDIDKVIITQWHTDHFGGAVSKDGRVLFSNGEYLISRVEAVHIRGTEKDWALVRDAALAGHLPYAPDER